jgi:hypothetical protein
MPATVSALKGPGDVNVVYGSISGSRYGNRAPALLQALDSLASRPHVAHTLVIVAQDAARSSQGLREESNIGPFEGIRLLISVAASGCIPQGADHTAPSTTS